MCAACHADLDSLLFEAGEKRAYVVVEAVAVAAGIFYAPVVVFGVRFYWGGDVRVTP